MVSRGFLWIVSTNDFPSAQTTPGRSQHLFMFFADVFVIQLSGLRTECHTLAVKEEHVR